MLLLYSYILVGKERILLFDDHMNSALDYYDKRWEASGTDIVAGRLEWQEALSTTFLKEWNALMAVRETFFAMMAFAARIFQGIALAEAGIPGEYLLSKSRYWHESYCSGFLLAAADWFPELAALRWCQKMDLFGNQPTEGLEDAQCG